MPKIIFDEQELALEPGESVLECLERHGHALASSCRAGACQSCVLQATSGSLPSAAQAGLKDTWKRRGYFMACVCRPETNMEVARLGEADEAEARVVAVERLSSTVTAVRLEPNRTFAYEPGQYVTLFRSDGLARSYSLASLPSDGSLELHVRFVPKGRMSSWIHTELQAGEPMRIRGPLGECFYTAGSVDDPILLCGTGTGLAPLWGIARQALALGHRGPIAIVHGATEPSRLYHVEPLRALVRAHANVSYVPCVLQGEAPGIRTAEVEPTALEVLTRIGTPARVRAFLCGDPVVVQRLRRRLFLAGVSLTRISVDAFVMGPAPS